MIIYGSEAYLMEEGRRQFFEAARKRSGGDAEVQTFQKDAAAATVVESFQGTSLFSSGTITVWYDCPFLPLKRGGRSRSKVSKEEQWFLDEAGRLDDGNSLLFYSKGNVDTGSAFFKALKPMAQVVAAEAVSEKNVMPYVTAYLKKQGKSLSRDGVVFCRTCSRPGAAFPCSTSFPNSINCASPCPRGNRASDRTTWPISLPAPWKRISSPSWTPSSAAMGKRHCPLSKGCSASKMPF